MKKTFLSFAITTTVFAKNILYLLIAIILSSFSVNAQTWNCTPPSNALLLQGTPGSCTATLENGVLTISGTGEMKNHSQSGDVPWYNKRGNVDSIVISTGITLIGNGTFLNTAASSVKIPSSVEWIGYGAFNGAGNLTTVDVTGVKIIDHYAFANTGLTSVDLTGVDLIENYVFQNTPLTSLVIPDSSTIRINSNAFAGMISTGTIFCPAQIDCTGKGYSGNIQSYEKEGDLYRIGDSYYASPDDMSNGLVCNIGADCNSRNAAYKDAKAQTMVGNGLCNTKKECLNLLNMVDDSNYTCGSQGIKNTVTNCAAFVKANGILLADLYPDLISNGGQAPNYQPKRIYTVEEAERVSKPTGNKIMLRYK